MENQNSNLKVASNGWIIVGFIFAILGGLIGIGMGANYAFGNYDKSTKNKGWTMIVIGVVMIAIWKGIASA